MNKLKVGVLGGGGIVGAHVRGFERVRDICEVAAVAEPDPGRHDAIRKWFGRDVVILPDYHALLEIGDIRAVDICLPHDMHMKAAVAAAEAGKHVLVEKCMARNVWECDRMIEACAKYGVTLSLCHDRDMDSCWNALKDVISSGALGDIFFFKMDHNQNVALPPGHWIGNYDRVGGGAVMSCLTHQLAALCWFGGPADAVNCMTKVIPDRMEGEFLGVMAVRMKSGALAQLSINWWTRSHVGGNPLWYEMVHACGDRGEAYYMSGRGVFVKLHDKESPFLGKYGQEAMEDFVKVCDGPGDGHANLVSEWVKGLAGIPSRPVPDAVIGRSAVELAEAAYMSVEARAEIALPVSQIPWVNRSNPELIKRQFAGSGVKAPVDKPNQANPLSNK